MLNQTMIQNIEQTAQEWFSMYADENTTEEVIVSQAESNFDNEYFDFEATDTDKEEYISAFVRGAK